MIRTQRAVSATKQNLRLGTSSESFLYPQVSVCGRHSESPLTPIQDSPKTCPIDFTGLLGLNERVGRRFGSLKTPYNDIIFTIQK